MIKLSWKDVEKNTEKLARKIQRSGFKADYIIGVTTGGLIPLYFISKRLKLTKKILTVSVSSYEKDKKTKLKIIYLPKINLKNKKILLVDDIAETGDTLNRISKEIIKKYKVKELRSATLGLNTDKCEFLPDYYALEEKGEWVVFPWETEDFPEYFKS